MRIQIVVLALALGLAVGCASQNWGRDIVWGNGMVGQDCTIYAGEIECETVVKGAELGGVAGGIVSKVIDTAVSVAGRFVPGGLDSGEPDTLRVELVEE